MTEKTVTEDPHHTDTEIQHTFKSPMDEGRGGFETAASKKHRN